MISTRKLITGPQPNSKLQSDTMALLCRYHGVESSRENSPRSAVLQSNWSWSMLYYTSSTGPPAKLHRAPGYRESAHMGVEGKPGRLRFDFFLFFFFSLLSSRLYLWICFVSLDIYIYLRVACTWTFLSFLEMIWSLFFWTFWIWCLLHLWYHQVSWGGCEHWPDIRLASSWQPHL